MIKNFRNLLYYILLYILLYTCRVLYITIHITVYMYSIIYYYTYYCIHVEYYITLYFQCCISSTLPKFILSQSRKILAGLGIRSLVFLNKSERAICSFKKELSALFALLVKSYDSDLLFCFGHKKGESRMKRINLKFSFQRPF